MAGLAQVAVLLVLLAAAWRPLGDWMARVYTDERDWRVERPVYRLVRVDPRSEQRASTYTVAILAFSFAGIVLLYLLQRLQSLLPWSFAGPRRAERREAAEWSPGSRSTPRSRSSRTRTGSPTSPRRPWATPSRWPG